MTQMNRRKATLAFAGVGVAFALAASFAAPKAPSYHVLRKAVIGGEGFWDYLTADGATHRLYISRGTHVAVVDTTTDRVVGDIPNTQGVHGIALAPKIHCGFTSNGRDNSVSIINLRTLREIKRVHVGTNPDCIVFDPASNRVFTFNGGSNNATAVNAVTGAVEGTIALGGRPEYAAADGKGSIYCNIEDKSEITAIDTRTLKVKKTWSLSPGEGPSGLAIDVKHRRLFSVCDNEKMVITDADTGRVIATPTIGKGPDAAAFDPASGLAFSSNGEDGNLTVVQEKDANTFEVVATVPTENGARTMALDAVTHRIYLATAKFGAAAAGQRRRSMQAGSFTILVAGP